MSDAVPGGETDLAAILDALTVSRRAGVFHVVAVAAAQAGGLGVGSGIEALIREPEAVGETVTVVCDTEALERHGWSSAFDAAWLTIDVHTSMEAVGLTAAMSAALGAQQIPCNILAGFHHDHLLVPVDLADRAVDCLLSLRDRDGRAGR